MAESTEVIELDEPKDHAHGEDIDSHSDGECSLFFQDGIRPIDFVLVWDQFDSQASTQRCEQMRKIFEDTLEIEGLQLEYESDGSHGLCFIKITAPKQVLRKYAEILKLRMPMKDIQDVDISSHQQNQLLQEMNILIEKFMNQYHVNQEIFPPLKHKFTAVYSRDKEYLFDVDSADFFTSATRSRIVQVILDRTRFSLDREDDFAFGIERLLSENAYSASYPLHDGNLKTKNSTRYHLYTEWASLEKIFCYQPLDHIKEYFGVKIGLYFAWLGFYTYMLLSASIVGVMCFIHSLYTLSNYEPSKDVCTSNYIMCPLCDHFCSFWNLKDTCFHSKITYVIDNSSTVFFTIFMSLWATLFLELWKKYSAEITHRWDLSSLDIQEEHPRPKYLARLAHVKKKKVNFVTNNAEPEVPFWKIRLPAAIFSCSIVILLIAVAMAAVLGVVLYRMSVLTALYSISKNSMVTSNAILLTTTTAAVINLCCIVIFNWVYTRLAEYLTEVELPRTQTEFDDSLTLKIYLLRFVNYYSSIFYIAFIKGKFTGYPGKYNRIFGSRQEECGPGGCLLELGIQLGIIMVGKQTINSVLEMLYPLYFKWLNTIRVRVGLQNESDDTDENKPSKKEPQWLQDYKLVEWGPRGLFSEYLEMVLQYGLVTIFVAAFPLAPLFALLNNILELRLDAKKLLRMYRRPVIQRVRDIGIWYKILDSISKISVITNAFIIAFTSNFIPRLVYRMAVSKNHTLEGFLEASLSKFNTSDDALASSSNGYSIYYPNNTICLYPDYREPPESKDKYKYKELFWYILAARLAFVVLFENLVAGVIIAVQWCIPDMSPKLRNRIRREAYVTNEIIIQHEAKRVINLPPGEDVCKERYVTRLDSAQHWNHVLQDSLSTSDFDLQVHGSPMSPKIDVSIDGSAEL
ncbi:hypothetical protein QAD02_023779 [Eretmocerus hayati]|uniref:Uncharacterized protein n=1 Tax=Eretmocerus hayati TaxID=131215 RepID=A0ACC2PWJ5_9HYME|nr:hypothetical protein QAD02_023779 [Eretmocerus hayati]